jgi:competence protein ComEA
VTRALAWTISVLVTMGPALASAEAEHLQRLRPANAPGAPQTLPPLRLSAAAPAPEGTVNINDASAGELEELPGIGPAKARAIVEHRRGHPFHKVDDLVRVKGIGRKTFGRLRPYITVVGPTTLKRGAVEGR